MGQQGNKPDNESLRSMNKPARVQKKGPENQAQEFINETDDKTAEAVPSTAERGKQSRTTQLKKTNEMGRNS